MCNDDNEWWGRWARADAGYEAVCGRKKVRLSDAGLWTLFHNGFRATGSRDFVDRDFEAAARSYRKYATANNLPPPPADWWPEADPNKEPTMPAEKPANNKPTTRVVFESNPQTEEPRLIKDLPAGAVFSQAGDVFMRLPHYFDETVRYACMKITVGADGNMTPHGHRLYRSAKHDHLLDCTITISGPIK